MSRLTEAKRPMVIAELRACAESWEPEACLLGNVTAAEIQSVLAHLRTLERMADALRAERDSWKRHYEEVRAEKADDDLAMELRGFEACREEAAKIADRAAWADESDAAEIARDIRKLQPTGAARTQGSDT